MAMNKREQQQVADLKCQLRQAKALRYSEPVEPDIPVPGSVTELSKGFAYGAYLSCCPRVEPACSSSISHSVGRDDKTTSQRPMPLYSTELLAWRAARNDVEQQAAVVLAKIDEQIERLALQGSVS